MSSTESATGDKRHRRSQTGCITCRARRVKCDEAKPSCWRCASTGRRCDGYRTPNPEISPSGFFVISTILPNPSLGGCARPPACAMMARREFHQFTNVFAPMLSGYGTEGFWNGVVLQASFADESIKHLIIAASNLYCNPTLSSGKIENPYFLTHYGKALEKLSCASQPDVIVILVACILFAFCDEIRDQSSSAVDHIQAGLRILEAQSNSRLSSWKNTTALSEITSTFSRLSCPRPKSSLLNIATS